MIQPTSSVPGEVKLKKKKPKVWQLEGHKGSLLALLAGAIMPLSLAPYDWWPAGILSLAMFLVTLQQTPPRSALFRGWLYGIGQFGVGASWVYVSIHQYGNAPVILATLLTTIFVAAIALTFVASFAWCYARFFANSPQSVLLGFPALWVIFEWTRSWLLTGFPWLQAGYAHGDNWLAAWAPVTGVYGLSFVTALSAALLIELVKAARSQQPKRAAVLSGIITVPWLLSLALNQVEWVETRDQQIKIALLQPNITQDIKWQPAQRQKTLQLLREKTSLTLENDIVIWPENAIPMFRHQATYFIEEIADMAQASNTTIISGVPWFEPSKGNSNGIIHNSIIAFGQGEGHYHKQKLVPFGEYVPLQDLLRGLIDFFDLPMSDFKPGPADQRPLLVQHKGQTIKIAPYICYEVVYPDFTRKLAAQSDLLLTISDDSWFGNSIGPHQHLQMARMRALENGRFMLRGTNTGFTGLIGPKGEVISLAPRFKQLTHTGLVSTTSGITPFGRIGSWPTLLLSVLSLLCLAMGRKEGNRRQTSHHLE